MKVKGTEKRLTLRPSHCSQKKPLDKDLSTNDKNLPINKNYRGIFKADVKFLAKITVKPKSREIETHWTYLLLI